MANDNDRPAKDGEVLEPDSSPDTKGVDILAHFGDHYTERPDLLIETLEKYDPGFVKRMNEMFIALHAS